MRDRWSEPHRGSEPPGNTLRNSHGGVGTSAQAPEFCEELRLEPRFDITIGQCHLLAGRQAILDKHLVMQAQFQGVFQL